MQQVRDSFQRELNLHGYGFQFRVLREAKEQADRFESKRVFRVSEFPVQVQGSGTRIDFILFRQPYPFWRADMICECKRSNPAISNWCFARSPFVHRNYPKSTDLLVLESILRPAAGKDLRVFAKADNAVDAYHVGLPVRTGQQGDEQPVKQSRSEIEDAASQVMRGVNGYIEMLTENPQLTETAEQDVIVKLLPVIFTTANLWVSRADLSEADLATGRIDLSEKEFEPSPWLWYQYNVSPGLKHANAPIEKQRNLEEHMMMEHVRSIAVVSPSGIGDFLAQTSQSL